MHHRLLFCLRCALVCLVMLVPCLWPMQCCAADDGLVFATERMPPLTLGELGREAHGGMIQNMLREVFGRLGREVRLELMPFARALRTVKAGQADGVPLLIRTPERESFLVYTDEVVRDRECFYYRPDRLGDFTWDGYGDLEGLMVGLVHGYEYTRPFMTAVDQGQVSVEYAPDSEANLRKLVAGRVDIVLEGDFQFMAVMENHPEWRGDIRRALPEVGAYAWHMGLSRSRPDAAGLVRDINRVLRDMREDGTMDRIFGREGE